MRRRRRRSASTHSKRVSKRFAANVVRLSFIGLRVSNCSRTVVRLEVGDDGENRRRQEHSRADIRSQDSRLPPSAVTFCLIQKPTKIIIIHRPSSSLAMDNDAIASQLASTFAPLGVHVHVYTLESAAAAKKPKSATTAAWSTGRVVFAASTNFGFVY